MKHEEWSDWWIDFIENETDKSWQKDLGLLLTRSEKARSEWQAWRNVRDLVKAADPVSLPESGFYYEQLHQKIMAACQPSASNSFEGPPRSPTTCNRSKVY